MKKSVLTLALLMLLTGAAAVRAQTSDPDLNPPDDTAIPVDVDWHRGNHHHPVQPVPEPGTMALASMGLIALGAAARRRRGK